MLLCLLDFSWFQHVRIIQVSCSFIDDLLPDGLFFLIGAYNMDPYFEVEIDFPMKFMLSVYTFLLSGLIFTEIVSYSFCVYYFDHLM